MAALPSPDELCSAAYWRQLCPELHVEDKAFQARVVALQAEAGASSPQDCAEVRRRLVEEGFAALEPAQLRWSVDVHALARGVVTLQEHGWAATFICLYDEAWAMAGDASRIMQLATGNSLSMDIVGFLVDPRQTKGFSPHRDRQPEDWEPRGVPHEVSSTFKSDGMAKYVTLWAALTDANPENSCLHFIPKESDPGFLRGDSDTGDPLKLCFPDGNAYQNIRSVPMPAGGCTFHTHRTIHWGNRGRPSYTGGPRIALSFGFSTPDFEPPYFTAKSLPFPAVKLRAALVCAQVLNYATLSAGDAQGWQAVAGSMSDCTASTLKLLHRVFQRHAKAFHPTFRKEIAKKFVKVSLSLSPGKSLSSVTSNNTNTTNNNNNSLAAESSTCKVSVEEPTSLQAAAARDPKLAPGSGSEGRKLSSATEQKDAGGRADEDSDDDDDALAAMLDAEADTGEVLFHDDFDMLNAGDAPSTGTWQPSREKSNKKRRKLERRSGGASTAAEPTARTKMRKTRR
ncbi:unnamed protein product [Polarella glacialis]|uniref:Phytanoyl-CoA dioxygenase n=1 Tax=Polarella glacialis TaxID=89957 RepID=A0A813GZE3_POLGL|nr:unnamed protein product [Polarella glacialis]CAE8717565.1 unnamed protein product [Polarella glacialis]